MKQRVLKYLTKWPDVAGETYRTEVEPKLRVTPFDSGHVPCRETLRLVRYQLEKVYMNNVTGFAWVLSDAGADIEVIDNRVAREPIAFKTAAQLQYEYFQSGNETDFVTKNKGEVPWKDLSE